MPKWISIDGAVHKYEVKEEDVCLWAETEAIAASFTETTLIIDEESLQKFLCWHEALPTKEYIQTVEQLCMNQAEICKLSLEVIELQKRDLQHQQKTIALLEKRQAMATEQNRLNQQVITMVSDTLSKTEDGWMERLWRRIRVTEPAQNILKSKHKKKR